MPVCNVIVDSCSYFRLAQSIRPLLKTPFGRNKNCLGVIEALNKEYEKSPTLKNTFFWVNQQEYRDNRKNCFSPTLKERSEINHAFFFIRDFVRENRYGVSEVDVSGLAYAYALKIPMVTDDSEMLGVAKEFGIKSTILLHHTSLDCLASFLASDNTSFHGCRFTLRCFLRECAT